MKRNDLLLTIAAVTLCGLGYLGCGAAFARLMDASDFSMSWWLLILSWPAVVAAFFAIGFAAVAFGVALGKAALLQFSLSRPCKHIE
jgi:hypothetical protein